MSSRTLLALLALVALAGCDAAPPAPTPFVPYEPEPGTPESIAFENGLTRHLGAAPPAQTRTSGTTTTFEFDPADGPMCMRGDTFRAAVRETASDDLLIFLQGGGACWSAFCLAITAAPPGIPRTDLLRQEPENPLADWDVLYVPYCDGSLFAGDNDIDEDGDGTPDRFHHGLANLSAALSQGYERFPHPSRVVLAGSSGGGYGTILAAFLVRYVYPDVPILVLDDAGVGVARPGEPEFVDTLIDEFGARDFLPEDCTECTGDGHITGLVAYLLEHDPGIRFGVISSWYDYVISQVFLDLDPAVYRDALDEETTALHEAFPDRYRRFVFAGEAHTALLGDVSGIVGRDISAVELPPDASSLLGAVQIESMHTASVDGVVLASWVRAMVDGDDAAWADLLSEPGEPPVPATMP